MDQEPLVKEQIDAGERIAQAAGERIPLRAAFWLKDAEDGRWVFYLATDSDPYEGFDKAFPLLQAEQGVWSDEFRFRVVGTDDSAARDVLEIQRTYPDFLPRRLRTQLLGGRYIEDSYLYAAPVAAAG